MLSRLPFRLRGPLGALLLVLATLAAVQPGLRVQPLGVFDQPFYLGIAQDLRDTGRFTDGYMFGEPLPDGIRPPGMRFAPLYPALLAAAARLDPVLARSMACEVRSRGRDLTCPRAAPSMRLLQFAMLAGVLMLIWQMGSAASGSCRVAWLALLAALPTAGMLAATADYLMTETTCLLASTAATAAALRALRAGASSRDTAALRWWAATGLLLGLAVLTRPAFLYLAYAIVAAGLALAIWRGLAVRPNRSTTLTAPPMASGLRQARISARSGAVRALLATLVLTAGTAAPVLPWIARNATMLGRPTLTYGYDSHTLVQRISFDSMTWREYGLAYLCWLPDGNGLGRLLDGPGTCDRFGWDDRPDTFYSIGMGPLMQQTLAEAGGWDHHLHFLLTHYIAREPLWHAAVTIPLALRGAWVDHYWGLVLGPCCLWLTLAALRRLWRERLWRERHHVALPPSGRTAASLLVLALPAWFMLAFNAAVAVNQVRYNLMLIPAYALSAGLLAERALRRLDRARARPFAAGSTQDQDSATPVMLPWQEPPWPARASGSARSSAGRRRRS